MRLKCTLAVLFVMIAAPFAFVSSVAAQGEGQEICPQFVSGVIDDLGLNCANHLAGEVCYGYENVEALPIPGVTFPAGEFVAPGDRLPVTDVARISTSELDIDATPPTWGFALVKVDAYIGMNEETGEPETADLLYILPGGVELEAVNEPVYDSNGDLVLDDLHLASLQEVFLRNQFDMPECPNALRPFMIVQGDPDQAIDIIVNETVIRVEGTILLEILPDADLETGEDLRVTTLFGMATLNPDTANEVLVPPGFFSDICLAEAEDLGLDGDENDQPIGDCDWTAPQPLSQADLDLLPLLEEFPDNTVIDPLDVPTLITASGTGGPQPRFLFENPQATALAQAACSAMPPLLPEAVCDYLF